MVGLNLKRLTEQERITRVEKNLKVHLEANKVKDILSVNGFDTTISLYSVIWNPGSQKHEYRRVEVFLNGEATGLNVGAIYDFFKTFPPYKYYTVWAFDSKTFDLILIEGWD